MSKLSLVSESIIDQLIFILAVVRLYLSEPKSVMTGSELAGKSVTFTLFFVLNGKTTAVIIALNKIESINFFIT